MNFKRLVLPLALVIALAGYQTMAESNQPQTNSGSSGLICRSVAGAAQKSCDTLCAAEGMTCTGFTSPVSPAGCDTATSEIGVCRCCKVK